MPTTKKSVKKSGAKPASKKAAPKKGAAPANMAATPNFSPLESSNLKGAAYDAASQRLTIQFKTKAVYQYDAVPPRLYRGLLNASSPGAYFARQIRSRYPYQKIR